MAGGAVRVPHGARPVIDHTQKLEYIDFANRVLDVDFDPAQCAWIAALNEDGTIAAVTVFNFVTTYNCEMSVASDGGRRWASRAFLGTCYRYAFRQLGLVRVTAVVEEDNTTSLTMCRKLGHVEEARLKNWFGTKDGVVMRMLKGECKWL